MTSYSAYGERPKVRVVARTRPTAKFPHDVVGIEEDGKTIKISLPDNKDRLHGFLNNQQLTWSFKMDKMLHNASQDEVYHRCASDLVSHVLDGYNATVMAFGQTGAGKTYTMTGSSTLYGQRGIIPRAISQLFREAEERQDYSVNIRVSYLEIYNDCIRDLLCTLPDAEPPPFGTKPVRSSLTVSEDGSGHVSVKGLSVKAARSEEEALNMLFEGETNRCIAEHSLNQYSSRSHCIFTLYVETRSRTHSLASFTNSKLSLVDLAGSERLNKTNTSQDTECEAKYINKSLAFLEQVTLALTEKHRDHIPYRQSKLTHILKDSIGGNCSTLMIANIWAEMEQIEETISTLKFAARMMRVANHPVKNVLQDPQMLIKEHEDEIKALRMELAMHDTLVGKSATTYEPLSEVDIEEIDRQIKLYVSGVISELEIRGVRQVKGILARFKNLVMSNETIAQMSSATNVAAAPSADRESTIPPKRSSYTAASKSRKAQHVKTLAPPTGSGSEAVDSEIMGQDSRVGDKDGMGFELGVAPPDAKVSPLLDPKRSGSPVSIPKKSSKGASSTPGPTGRGKDSSKSLPREELKVMVDTSEEGRCSSHSSVDEVSQSPPPKDDEFEKFKKGRGQKIHSAFLSNKEQYHKKKKECVELAAEINDLKKEIDKEREFLEEHKKARQLQNVIPHMADTGEVILDETEFSALTHLKELKLEYRKRYETLKVEQAQLKTLSQYVDKARSKLLVEFEEWYRVCYIGGEPIEGTLCEDMDGESEQPETRKRTESEFEKFERLQHDLLKKDPSTAAFYHAQLRTERRSLTRKQQRTHKPGELTATVRNKPPGVLAFT